MNQIYKNTYREYKGKHREIYGRKVRSLRDSIILLIVRLQRYFISLWSFFSPTDRERRPTMKKQRLKGKHKTRRIITITTAVMLLLPKGYLVYGETYEYDPLNRIQKVYYDDGSVASYSYDANGNIQNVNLFQQWENKATNIYLDNDRLNMVINGERIYIDYCENGDADYEEDELIKIDIGTPSFYSICYSDKNTMKYFIQNSIFDKGSFMDNDLGKIVRLDELMMEEILNFIQ